MKRVLVLLGALVVCGACRSKPTTEGAAEESSGEERGTNYRELEGSPYLSSEEAGNQLAGE